ASRVQAYEDQFSRFHLHADIFFTQTRGQAEIETSEPEAQAQVSNLGRRVARKAARRFGTLAGASGSFQPARSIKRNGVPRTLANTPFCLQGCARGTPRVRSVRRTDRRPSCPSACRPSSPFASPSCRHPSCPFASPSCHRPS